MGTVILQEQASGELTLLALNERYALLGDGGGLLRRACSKCIGKTKTVNPRRLYIDSKPEIIFGFPVMASEDCPRDLLITPQPIRDFITGLGVRAAFDPKSRTWFVAEILDPLTDEPTGRFSFTAEEPLLWGS